MSKELRECPFCGVKPGITNANDEWYVFCTDSECSCEPALLIGRRSKDQAITAWNRRQSAPEENDVWLNCLIDAVHQVIECDKSNSGNEPSISCFHRAMDRLKDIALASDEPENAWQKFDSAPRDGSVFFAWHVIHKVPVAIKFVGEKPPNWAGFDFVDATLSASWPDNSFSHWMPIPPNLSCIGV